MRTITTYIERLRPLHDHLCPRQILGVRMGWLARDMFGLDLPQTNKRLFTFVETDGCFADGISVATGCWLGRRTLRLMDYGKVVATFVDTRTCTALRVWPHPEARKRSSEYASSEPTRWHKMLKAYQIMPTEKLLCWRFVELTVSLKSIISKPGMRVTCSQCGDEIINEREVILEGLPICRACHETSYYLE